jgi:hypothetical protein
MKALVGALGLVWALANLFAAYVMARGGITAPTPAKEGFAAQALLFLGSVVLAVFALALIWGCARLAFGKQAGE